MRLGIIAIISGAIGFVVAGWYRQQVLDEPLEMPDFAYGVVPYQPPPLNLPTDTTCTQELDLEGIADPLIAADPNLARALWTAEGVEDYLAAQTEPHENVDLIEVDCSDDPCIAWLLWNEGCDDPSLAYRWWSLEGGIPAAALWTTSRTFPVALPDAPNAVLQAVSVAPSGLAHETASAWQTMVQARQNAQLDSLTIQVGATQRE
ncbi:MAG: hypothetical protein AAGA48_18725 [Myxococcota bacterium]